MQIYVFCLVSVIVAFMCWYMQSLLNITRVQLKSVLITSCASSALCDRYNILSSYWYLKCCYIIMSIQIVTTMLIHWVLAVNGLYS